MASALASAQDGYEDPESEETEKTGETEDDDPETRRAKALQVTVGRSPTSLDIGNEADLLTVTDDEEFSTALDKWTFNFKGYIRAGVTLGLGPRNDGGAGTELHSPARIVGAGSGRWEYASLAQNPALSLYLNFSNPVVSANVIISGNTLIDPSYEGNHDRVNPGVRQAYLILKYPDAFGSRGGLSLTVGGFSNRYGSAGREQVSSGYYGAYLFGRTHVAGEVLTADVDLSDDWELVLEHGFGAKIDVIPFLSTDQILGDVTDLDYFEGQGQVPSGSNFAHHAHVGFLHGGWLMLAAHYLTSWTPDDNNLTPAGTPIPEGRVHVMGAEVHVDGDAIGNGYLGFSHIVGNNVRALSNAVQLPHGSSGRSFKESFWGERDRVGGRTSTNDSGTVDTVLFQYTLGLAQYLGRLPFGARDLRVAAYGMFNHAVSEKTDPNDDLQLDIDTYKLKVGTEWQLELFKYMAVGFQFDRVLPDVSDTATGYTAITPRLTLRTSWQTKERIILNYTRFFLGDRAYPSSPFSDLLEADRDLFSITAIMSF